MSHIAVQAGHAVGEFCKVHPEEAKNDWDNTLVYLGVADEMELNQWATLLKAVEATHVEWREEWWENSFTSFGVLGTPEVQKLVKGLKLI